ncbi:MAG TPA: PQQ-binding-like beta-propeller repeat protein [Gemmataceae bacterium]|nr:PQQ-binding-like beta-propeller repeat protein [Gemmataceae bacterium]
MARLSSAVVLAALLLMAPAAPAADKDEAPRTDSHGDPLPAGALLRLGTVRWRACARFLAFTPDGKTLVTGEMNGDKVIRFWDAATGRETAMFRPPSAVTAFALARDGKSLALNAGWETKGVVFVSIPDGKELRRIDDESTYFHFLCFSPDGKSLAGVGNDGVVRVWDPANGKEILREQEDSEGRDCHVAFSPDGKRLVVGLPPDKLRVLEVATGKELFKQQLNQGTATRFTAVGFSPDGKRLFWAGDDRRSFALRDATTGETLRSFRVAQGTVRAVAFSPDGKLIASLDVDDDAPPSVGLWDAATGKELRKLPSLGAAGWIADPVFSPDGKRLAFADDYDGLLHMWDVETGKDAAQVGEHRAMLCTAAFAPDGRTALTGCADHVVRVWDAAKGTVLRRIDVAGLAGNPMSYQIVLSDDRKTAALINFKADAQIWDLEMGKKRADLDGGEDKSWTAVFSPDGKLLALRGNFGTGVQLWDAATGKKASRIPIDDNGLGEFAFSPDGKSLVVLRHQHDAATGANGGAEMSLWDVAAGKEVAEWPTPITWGGFGLQFSPDGRRIAVIGQSAHEVDLWDPAGPKQAASLTAPKDSQATGFMECLAFSRDGRMLAAGCDNGPVCLWEVSTAKVRVVLIGHRDRVRSVDFSPDGARLISASNDTTALIWDLTGLVDDKSPKTLTPERLASLWDDLADADAGKAWRAGWRLTADPAASVAFLRKRLRPAVVDADRIARLLAGLDSDDFEAREKASGELAKLGDLAEPALRRALEGKPSAEARQRLEELVRRLDGLVHDAEQVRGLRGVEALEHMGTAEARRLLGELAKGAEGSRQTGEAKAALERLADRPNSDP